MSIGIDWEAVRQALRRGDMSHGQIDAVVRLAETAEGLKQDDCPEYLCWWCFTEDGHVWPCPVEMLEEVESD